MGAGLPNLHGAGKARPHHKGRPGAMCIYLCMRRLVSTLIFVHTFFAYMYLHLLYLNSLTSFEYVYIYIHIYT